MLIIKKKKRMVLNLVIEMYVVVAFNNDTGQRTYTSRAYGDFEMDVMLRDLDIQMNKFKGQNVDVSALAGKNLETIVKNNPRYFTVG
jgi:hypothetical protein